MMTDYNIETYDQEELKSVILNDDEGGFMYEVFVDKKDDNKITVMNNEGYSFEIDRDFNIKVYHKNRKEKTEISFPTLVSCCGDSIRTSVFRL